MAYNYPYPRPAVATDICVYGLAQETLSLVLVRRGEDPFRGRWALPGDFLRPEETLDQCAARELHEETGVAGASGMQFATFSAPDRDPRDRVISVAYLAVIDHERARLKAGSDAAEAGWFAVDALPHLAFDHMQIVTQSLMVLKQEIWRSPLLLGGLPEHFTLSRLQEVYDAVEDASAKATGITARPVDKRNFRKWMLETDWIEETGDYVRGAHRPAQLYRQRPSSISEA